MGKDRERFVNFDEAFRNCRLRKHVNRIKENSQVTLTNKVKELGTRN
jgi:hypothetical protein